MYTKSVWKLTEMCMPRKLWAKYGLVDCVITQHDILRVYKCNLMRCPWSNGYRRRKWTRRHEFKSWPRLIAFHIALIPLGKV